jgi:hypothetical protein
MCKVCDKAEENLYTPVGVMEECGICYKKGYPMYEGIYYNPNCKVHRSKAKAERGLR